MPVTHVHVHEWCKEVLEGSNTKHRENTSKVSSTATLTGSRKALVQTVHTPPVLLECDAHILNAFTFTLPTCKLELGKALHSSACNYSCTCTH